MGVFFSVTLYMSDLIYPFPGMLAECPLWTLLYQNRNGSNYLRIYLKCIKFPKNVSITFEQGLKSLLFLQKSSCVPMFWLVTAYSLLSDALYMRRHHTHLTLTLFLSMFTGTLLIACLLLDFRRRLQRNNKTDDDIGCKDEEEHLRDTNYLLDDSSRSYSSLPHNGSRSNSSLPHNGTRSNCSLPHDGSRSYESRTTSAAYPRPTEAKPLGNNNSARWGDVNSILHIDNSADFYQNNNNNRTPFSLPSRQEGNARPTLKRANKIEEENSNTQLCDSSTLCSRDLLTPPIQFRNDEPSATPPAYTDIVQKDKIYPTLADRKHVMRITNKTKHQPSRHAKKRRMQKINSHDDKRMLDEISKGQYFERNGGSVSSIKGESEFGFQGHSAMTSSDAFLSNYYDPYDSSSLSSSSAITR